jgi:ABC-type multidrug transport system ATPase subunit
MADRDPVVTLDGVTVVYGAQQALQDVSATFAAGAVGLLGPNGAGKSTMIKALLGFVVPDTGRMRVLGRDVAAQARRLHAGKRRAHSRHECGHIRRVLRRALRVATG